MLLNANLRNTNYEIIIHKIRIKEMLKNMGKKEQKYLLRLTKTYIQI